MPGETILIVDDAPSIRRMLSEFLTDLNYHVLLALEEAGAHVEDLYQRGELAAANVEEIEKQGQPVITYRRV